jgi:hypothetical protein
MIETTQMSNDKIWFTYTVEYYPPFKKEYSNTCYNIDES